MSALSDIFQIRNKSVILVSFNQRTPFDFFLLMEYEAKLLILLYSEALLCYST